MGRKNRPKHSAPRRNRSRRSALEADALRAIERPLPSSRARRPKGEPPSTTFVRCPTGKAGFPEVEARRRLELYASESSSRRTKPLRVYPCPKCQAWHLTSRPL